jgi:hypothetical protein
MQFFKSILEGRLTQLSAVAVLSGTLALSGCGKKVASATNVIEGVTKYKFEVANGRANLSVVFSNLHMDAGATIPLSRPQGGTIQLGPDFESGGSIFVISTPLSSLSNNAGLPMAGLPDGRPIPGIRQGVLQAAQVNLPIIGMTYLYMGSDVFGLFVPVNLGSLALTVTVRIRDEKGNLVGTLAGIPRGQTGSMSGVLFLFPIDGGTSANYLYSVT